ncbi:hypothetical protein C8Q73DRAFT_270586 [Cubamyces lactineus]|nr:hypothetical protein C8Q73DRAFT_270586 [Cubamyces lactineus]
MTSLADSDLIAEVQSIIVGDYCQVAATTMLAYYYVTTLHEEFDYWYKRKLTCATLLYMVNRYVPLTYALYGPPIWPLSATPRNCIAQQISAVVLDNVQYFPWAVGNALVVLLCRPYCWMRSVRTCPTRCATMVLAIMARLPLVLADLTVIVVTWVTQYRQHKMALSILGGGGLATVMLQNGTLYFLVMSILNILQMMFEVLRIFSRIPGEAISNLSILTEPVTAILVSSFLNDLRKAADFNAHQESLSSMGTMEFRVMGSIGASLIPSEDVTLEGDDVELGSLNLKANEKRLATGSTHNELPQVSGETCPDIS